MKKKLLATAASVAALSTMLVVPAVAGLYSEDETFEATGVGSVVSPVISVVLPADLSFGINPLSLDADGDDKSDAQIIATDFTMMNMSTVPVAVNAATSATAGAATLTNSAVFNQLSNEMMCDTASPEVFLLQVLPTELAYDTNTGVISATNNALDKENRLTDCKITDTATALSASTIILTDVAENVTFKLDKSTDGSIDVLDCASFSLAGAVDPNSVFVDGDLTVKTVFSLDVISDAEYAGNYLADERFISNDTDDKVVSQVSILTGTALTN